MDALVSANSMSEDRACRCFADYPGNLKGGARASRSCSSNSCHFSSPPTHVHSTRLHFITFVYNNCSRKPFTNRSVLLLFSSASGVSINSINSRPTPLSTSDQHDYNLRVFTRMENQREANKAFLECLLPYVMFHKRKTQPTPTEAAELFPSLGLDGATSDIPNIPRRSPSSNVAGSAGWEDDGGYRHDNARNIDEQRLLEQREQTSQSPTLSADVAEAEIQSPGHVTQDIMPRTSSTQHGHVPGADQGNRPSLPWRSSAAPPRNTLQANADPTPTAALNKSEPKNRVLSPQATAPSYAQAMKSAPPPSPPPRPKASSLQALGRKGSKSALKSTASNGGTSSAAGTRRDSGSYSSQGKATSQIPATKSTKPAGTAAGAGGGPYADTERTGGTEAWREIIKEDADEVVDGAGGGHDGTDETATIVIGARRDKAKHIGIGNGSKYDSCGRNSRRNRVSSR